MNESRHNMKDSFEYFYDVMYFVENQKEDVMDDNDKRKLLDVEGINEDTDIHEFAMFCREYDKRWNNPQTEAEKLVYRMTHGEKTNEEYLELQDDVRKFIASDASEEDKHKVGGYAESLCMICNAIREGLL